MLNFKELPTSLALDTVIPSGPSAFESATVAASCVITPSGSSRSCLRTALPRLLLLVLCEAPVITGAQIAAPAVGDVSTKWLPQWLLSAVASAPGIPGAPSPGLSRSPTPSEKCCSTLVRAEPNPSLLRSPFVDGTAAEESAAMLPP
mmetsp:Transcript_33948/g.97615  ORF Transcript_33948/g.97615 Transcript_33948/m.97615 type:complete len:147 (-) Transcript_33948:618-1058(-)